MFLKNRLQFACATLIIFGILKKINAKSYSANKKVISFKFNYLLLDRANAGVLCKVSFGIV